VETLRISIGNEGVRGFPSSEMELMTNKQTVFIPPVLLDNYSDFESIIDEAAMVVYSPEYFHGWTKADTKAHSISSGGREKRTSPHLQICP
jgi:hypothetical protein